MPPIFLPVYSDYSLLSNHIAQQSPAPWIAFSSYHFLPLNHPKSLFSRFFPEEQFKQFHLLPFFLLLRHLPAFSIGVVTFVLFFFSLLFSVIYSLLSSCNNYFILF